MNIRETLGIGTYANEKNYEIPLSGGVAGMNIRVEAVHDRQNTYFRRVSFSSYSTGNVQVIGVTYYNFDDIVDGVIARSQLLYLAFPLPEYSRRIRLSLYKNNNLTVKGEVHAQFNDGVQIQNETFYFEIGVRILFDLADYAGWEISFIWIIILYFLAYPPVIYLLVRVSKSITRDIRSSPESNEKDKEFWDFIHRKKKVISEDSSV